jgi:hypothetical protein
VESPIRHGLEYRMSCRKVLPLMLWPTAPWRTCISERFLALEELGRKQATGKQTCV